MGHFKKLWQIGSRNILASAALSAVWMVVLFIGARLATYYAYHYHGYTNLTPTSTDKFFPVMLVMSVYIGLNTVWFLDTVWFRYGDEINDTAGVVKKVLGVIFKIILGVLKIVFFPIVWLYRFNEEVKIYGRERKRMYWQTIQDESDIRAAAGIKAREYLEEHRKKKMGGKEG